MEADVTMMMIRDGAGQVRPMGRHDVPLVMGMMAAEARANGDERGGGTMLPSASIDAALFGPAPRLYGLVVERFDAVVGYALLDPTPAPEAPGLRHLFIQPGSRGRGLGRMLIDRAAGGGPGRGLVADMSGRDSRARAFCTACGFVLRGEEARLSADCPAEEQAA